MSLKPHTLRRLDCPTTGPLVYLLGSAGDGYSRVLSYAGHVSFETLTERLHKPLN